MEYLIWKHHDCDIVRFGEARQFEPNNFIQASTNSITPNSWLMYFFADYHRKPWVLSPGIAAVFNSNEPAANRSAIFIDVAKAAMAMKTMKKW